MSAFYNREPWNHVVGVGLIVGIFWGLSNIFGRWVLFIFPIAVVYSQLKWRLMRAIQLRRRGYFSGHHKGDKWIYEEMHNGICVSLILRVENTEPGHYELFFPNESEWRSLVPDWAQERRAEIAQRISQAWKRSDFHLPPDFGT